MEKRITGVVAVSEGKVVATPVQKRKLSLKQLLAKVNKKNLHEEIDFGQSMGSEKVASASVWTDGDET
jgi:antitoxin component of MazEF toxin-antitoxin module